MTYPRLKWEWDYGCHCDQPVVTSATRLGNLCLRCNRERDPSLTSYSQWKSMQPKEATRS